LTHGNLWRRAGGAHIDASNDKLTSEATGEIELEGNVLVIQRIHVRYRLKAPADQRETIERVHEIHAKHCPVARSIEGAIEIRTSLEFV
jgi:organic hydroperoxide reductase OsmC/OhrA